MMETCKSFKITKSIFIIAFIITTICISLNSFNIFPLAKNQTLAKKEEITNISQNTENTEKIQEELITSDTKVEIAPAEDKQIKTLMQNIQDENKLNDKNFAFFYYNIDTRRTIFLQ